MKFLDRYNRKKNIRFEMFEKTLQIAVNRGLKTIVETGTSRGKKKFIFFNKFNWKDGMSTLMFSEFAYLIKGELHSCDISEENINSAKDFTKKYCDSVIFYLNDSVIFLQKFHKKIDLLYLDSFGGHDVELASEHQLKEAKAVINKLNDSSLVLLDDKCAKTLYSKDFFINGGFKILAETENQLLLSKML